MKVRNLIGAAIVAACGVARAHAGTWADDGTWDNVTTSNDGQDRYDVKNGSLVKTRTIAFVTTRVMHRHTGQADFYLMGLKRQACTDEMGELVITDLRGNKLAATDFVLGGGTIAAWVAEAICDRTQSRGAHARAPAADL